MEPQSQEATIAVVLEKIDNLTKSVDTLRQEIHSDREDKVTRREWELSNTATDRRLTELEGAKHRGWAIAGVVLSGLAIVAVIILALV